MSRSLTGAIIALAFVCASSAGLLAIRSKTEEKPTPKKPAATLADEALNRGMKRLETAERLEAGDPKGARKEFEAAVKDLKIATANAPDNYRAHNALGYSYRKIGNYTRALESYDRALTLAPGFAEAIEYRAEAFLGLNRIDEAKNAYMQLFVADRTASNVLLKAMKTWVGKRRVEPAGVDAATLDAFAAWVTERDGLAMSVGNLGHNSPDWK